MKRTIKTFESIGINSTLGELSLLDAEVDIDIKLSEALEILQSREELPGLIITEGGDYNTFASRKDIFQALSKPFGLELFSKKPIRFFLEFIGNEKALKLSAGIRITEGACKALERDVSSFDLPLVVEFSNGKLMILDSYDLMLANSRINTLAIEAFKEADELKTELLSIAAHDLKNPLNSIIALSKLVCEELGEAPIEAVEMTKQIKESAEHMHKLILELLNTTVIESGRIELKKDVVSIAELLFAIVNQNKSQAEFKKQKLHYAPTFSNEYDILGDAIGIRESIENLVSNAIKYSPQGAEIFITLKTVKNNALITVIDQGPGISKEDLGKLFKKFQRLSAIPTGGESSTGLGLYIAKNIIELHGGRIWAESNLGRGSAFYIELPKYSVAKEAV